MQIEIMIDGESKIFTTPVVPMRAKRLYFKIQAESEEKQKNDKDYPTYEDEMKEEDEMVGILANVVFGGQFTVDQVYDGAENKYVYDKLREAIFGEKPKEEKEGNNQGK